MNISQKKRSRNKNKKEIPKSGRETENTKDKKGNRYRVPVSQRIERSEGKQKLQKTRRLERKQETI